MKNMLRFAAAAVMACAAMACSKNGIDEENLLGGNGQETQNPNAEPILVSASFDELDTRFVADDDGVSKIVYKWNVGDQITVGNSLSGATTAYKFTAISVSDDGKNAIFESPKGYSGTPAIGLKLEKSWNSASFAAASVGGASTATILSTTTEELADGYRMYAIYDAENKRFSFKPLMALMRFEITLPASETAINSFRIQMQEGITALSTTGTSFNISSGTPVISRKDAYFFYKEGLNVSLDASNKAVLYLLVAATEMTANKKMEIIVNKKAYATQTCLAIKEGTVASIKKPVAKWSDAVYSAGLGTETAPYIVSNETNLRALADKVNTGTIYTGQFFKMENDITIVASAAKPWVPIGLTSTSLSFAGNFDGNNKTIDAGTLADFKLGEDESYSKLYAYVGLFGRITDCTIKDLTVKADVSYKNSPAQNFNVIGGICGGLRGAAKLSNCTHIGSIYGENLGGNICMGGLVGQMIGTATLSNCTQINNSTTATISVGPSSNIANYIGGIAGLSSTDNIIHQCRTVNTNLSAQTVPTNCHIGAISGRNNGTLSTCSTFSDVQIFKAGVSQPVTLTGNGTTGDCDQEHPVIKFGGGTGTEADPYLIDSEGTLRELATNVNAGTTYEGQFFKMENDITIVASAAKPWKPIGHSATIFRGNFDGNNKTIDAGTLADFDLSEEPAPNSYAFVGIFGRIYGTTTMKNLTVKADVSFKNSTASSLSLGGICASLQYNSVMSNCTHIGSVYGENLGSGRIYIGGLVGNTSQTSTMSNCQQISNSATASISLGPTQKNQVLDMGGIAGSLSADIHQCRTVNTNFSVQTVPTNCHIGAIAGTVGSNTLSTCSSFSNVQIFKAGVSQTVTLVGSGTTGNCDQGHTPLQ